MSQPEKIRDLFPNKLKKKIREEMDKKPEFQHPLQRYISTELENVAGIKKQLTLEQCERLFDNYSRAHIHQTLLEMENYNPLQKKYRSVFLTLRNWMKLKKDRQDAYQTKKSGKQPGWVATWEEALRWMQKNDLETDHLKYFERIEKEGQVLWRKK